MKKTETFEDAIPTANNLWFKIWKAKQEIGKINKSADNPFFKSKYADLNTILDVVEPILHKYNLILMQPVMDQRVFSQIIDVESGKTIESWIALPDITDPQKLGGCVSYYRRYTLQSLLSLSMQDDDANEVAKHVKNTKPKLDNDNLQKGLKQVSDGTLTKEKFIEMVSRFELSDAQNSLIKSL